MTGANADHDLTDLMRRVQALEDVQAIQQVIATYGFAVDSDSPSQVSALWSIDGTFDVHARVWSGGSMMRGRHEIEAMLGEEIHQSFRSLGCTHVNSLPRVVVEGDTGSALSYQYVIARTDAGYFVAAASVHHWQLRRSTAPASAYGWEIIAREGYPVASVEDARDLIRQDVTPPIPATDSNP
jgi:hypothetical protein